MATEIITEPDFDEVARVARHMRKRDAHEIFALRWHDDPQALARDVILLGAFRWSIRLDDVPVAVIGAHPRWPAVWTAYAFATHDWPRVVITATRHVRRFMLPALFNAGAIRADAHALEAHEDARKWLHHLGAEHEQTLKNWGKAGETFVSYVWTRDAARRIVEGGQV